uniref:Uncharacterized protein n=1 Tax=Sipha flava TaxID=143950 RepID=A0A2S2Q1Z6_9HEMI
MIRKRDEIFNLKAQCTKNYIKSCDLEKRLKFKTNVFERFQTAVRTSEKSSLDLALAECKRLEARCATESTGGWMAAVKRKLLFSSTAGGVDYYDRQIVLADMISCIVGLTVAAHKDSPSVGTVARAVYALRRAWTQVRSGSGSSRRTWPRFH